MRFIEKTDCKLSIRNSSVNALNAHKIKSLSTFVRFCCKLFALRPIYTEDVPGVAAHDSLFVLLRPGVAVPSRARAQTYPTQQNKHRIMRYACVTGPL